MTSGLPSPYELSVCFMCFWISPQTPSATSPLTLQTYMTRRTAHAGWRVYPRYPPIGIVAGRANVQFGGPHGLVCELRAGDVVVIPAGVGHCCLISRNLVVVGAYPFGQYWDLCRDTESDRAMALDNIPWVPLPQSDPVLGSRGPLVVCWRDD